MSLASLGAAIALLGVFGLVDFQIPSLPTVVTERAPRAERWPLPKRVRMRRARAAQREPVDRLPSIRRRQLNAWWARRAA